MAADNSKLRRRNYKAAYRAARRRLKEFDRILTGSSYFMGLGEMEDVLRDWARSVLAEMEAVK